ncbi:metal-sulfur cluster assembly factor [Amycolatopsis palatopharyngis]|uniref:metal-sulfur cluster assembly factor n=1 Tax=Amycolatopsis palatopharyngis TaxID=187982 RepID=UPI000E27A042|nr:metal-sulfur cluster assembly factor [Amycolatopsis palatopharyngis]
MSEQQTETRTEDQEHREGRTAADLPEQKQPAADVAKVEDVEEAMRDVVDPELGINVVDLGLVYGIHVEEDNSATIDMTLTSAACPLTDVIEDQTASALVGGAGLVKDFRINWVWMPPWGPEKITDDGREQLRALGFTV